MQVSKKTCIKKIRCHSGVVDGLLMKVVRAHTASERNICGVFFHKRRLRRETNAIRHCTADQLLTNIQQVLRSINQSIKLSIKHWSMQGTGLVCRTAEVYEIKSIVGQKVFEHYNKTETRKYRIFTTRSTRFTLNKCVGKERGSRRVRVCGLVCY